VSINSEAKALLDLVLPKFGMGCPYGTAKETVCLAKSGVEERERSYLLT
jgi:hypothetical protein